MLRWQSTCAGFQRTVTIALDTAQYQLDMEYMQEHKSEDVYSTFNLLMRRKPKVSVACLRGIRLHICLFWTAVDCRSVPVMCWPTCLASCCSIWYAVPAQLKQSIS